jgi:hypothetical protein
MYLPKTIPPQEIAILCCISRRIKHSYAETSQDEQENGKAKCGDIPQREPRSVSSRLERN